MRFVCFAFCTQLSARLGIGIQREFVALKRKKKKKMTQLDEELCLGLKGKNPNKQELGMGLGECGGLGRS